ncbi:MAG: hypothetical protein ACI9HK_004857 [Pirellulaceae bacterium]|jgi:hypothetical protein
MLIHQRTERKRVGRSPLAIGVAIAVVGFLCGIFTQFFGVVEKTCELVATQSSELPVRTVAWTKAPTLQVLNIDMKFKHFEKIKAKRDEALKTGVLLANASDFVPAEVRVDGHTIPVKMRLKGDWTDHLHGRKWSYRIHVKDGDQLWGMRSLSLHHPMTRNWDAEWLYHKHIRQEGVLGLRYKFVRVTLNGTSLGIYALEEHFSKELLESQQRKEGVIVKADESGFWEQQARFGTFVNLRNENLANTRLATFKDSAVEANPTLQNGRSAAFQLLHDFADNKIKPSQVFKVEQLARYLAITELWGSEHGLHFHNLRWYYDPLAGKLEPIAFDGNTLKSAGQDILGPRNDWVNLALSDDAISEAYTAEIERMSAPEYVAKLKHGLRDEWTNIVNSLRTEWPMYQADCWGVYGTKSDQKMLDGSALDCWTAFERRTQYVRSMYNETQFPLTGQYYVVDGQLHVELSNALKIPVEITGFKVNGNLLPAYAATRLYPKLWANKPHEVVETIGRVDEPPESVIAQCKILGHSHEMEVDLQHLDFRFSNTSTGLPQLPNAADFVAKHPFIERVDESTFRTRPGQWEVNGDLVVPQSHVLKVSPGTTLLFQKGAVLYSTDRIEAIGTSDEPIQFGPIADDWSGVAVLNAPTSEWAHVKVLNTTSIERNGWILTGGVTFFHSAVKMRNCTFEGSRGEDGLNVVSAQFLLEECDFTNTQSDAFDGDFVVGRIADCRFSNCAGDAIDFSGSNVSIQKTVVRSVADKAISAGENSTVRIENVSIRLARMAIVSKDLSRVEIKNVFVAQSKYGLSAFQKKTEYGPATIVASHVVMLKVEQESLTQSGSAITIDRVPTPVTDFDTKELYAAKETANDLAAK